MENEEVISVDSKIFPNGSTGIWLNIIGGSIRSSNGVNLDSLIKNSEIWNSDYGSPISHIGKDLY